jgi:NAD(P)H-hydrate epimerase
VTVEATVPEMLPTEDPFLATDADLETLAKHWLARGRMRPMTGEEMRGADARAQRMGMPGERLMEEAGVAVAAAARALIVTADRPVTGVVLMLCGPGNNGGDGLVAARHLSAAGFRVAVALVSADERPATRDAAGNWDRLEGLDGIERMHAGGPRAVAMLGNGIDRASLVVDALLGTGVRGSLWEPIRSAVDLIEQARRSGVPVLAVDTPTALDLTSGVPSDPCAHAEATITFHRPKVGLLTPGGRVLAGRVLVAPIGIPSQADPT